jgi:hypothetical protein
MAVYAEQIGKHSEPAAERSRVEDPPRLLTMGPTYRFSLSINRIGFPQFPSNHHLTFLADSSSTLHDH